MSLIQKTIAFILLSFSCSGYILLLVDLTAVARDLKALRSHVMIMEALQYKFNGAVLDDLKFPPCAKTSPGEYICH